MNLGQQISLASLYSLLNKKAGLQTKKLKLNIDEQVECLKNLGITFKYYSESDAKTFLTESNYFFKLKAFTKNYKKDKNNKYINLDFAYLRELSTLDTLLRALILELCLACEHLLKAQINTHCSNNDKEDGYSIVKSFLKNPKNKPRALERYEKGHKPNIYQQELIAKYYKKFF